MADIYGALTNALTFGGYDASKKSQAASEAQTAAIRAARPTAAIAGFDPNGAIAAANQRATEAANALAAAQAQAAAQPKLIKYGGTYADAQKQVQGTVDAVYQDKLNQYLQQEQLTTTQETRKAGETQADIAGNLVNQTADNATNRKRTGEDQTTKLGDVGTSETNYQADSGTAFDQARTALLGSIANSGLTTSGIGQGKVASSTAQRNQGDMEQTQQFDANRRDINTNATRTFEDLATSDTRNTQAAATGTARSKQGLQDYIDNANLAEQGFRTDNETSRQGALQIATNDQYQTGVRNFIASLVGSGARAQDIAATASIYGA